MTQKLSADTAKWMDELKNDTLTPPIKDLVSSDNFFNFDEGIMDAMNILDIDEMDKVMEVWKNDAYKKMKKKRREAKEIKPEEMTETIGDTLVGDDPNSESTTQQNGSDVCVQSLPPKSQSHTFSAGSSSLPGKHLLRSQTARTFETPDSWPRDMHDAVHQKQLVPVWKAPPIRQTMNMILIGQPYVLEWYKSLEEKRSLLKEAIATHDGNTIITVILFLRKTLSKALFEALLISNPVAASHYCSFLRQNAAWDQLKSVYYVLGEESYGMLQYQMCLNTENIQTRIRSLESCKLLFKDRPSLEREAVFITEYNNLLKRQQEIEIIRSGMPPSAINRYQGPPIVDSTVVTTLTYICRFHFNNPESPDVNAEIFKKDFSVCEKQYFVILLIALCAKRDWDNIERLLTPKGWQSKLGIGSKIKSPISLERVIFLLGKSVYKAPEEMMSKYIRQIDDLERRLEIATKYRCFGVGIEVLKQLKDTERLKAFVSQMSAPEQRRYRPMLAKMFS